MFALCDCQMGTKATVVLWLCLSDMVLIIYNYVVSSVVGLGNMCHHVDEFPFHFHVMCVEK